MKLKKIFSFSDKNQIWRLLVSDSDKLIIETRNTDQKEVYFNCIELERGKPIFKNLQLDDKFWIGIEIIKDDKIIFHRFAKPDMPEHKGIIVFDIKTQKIIWQNDDLIFLSALKDKIFAFRRKFEGRDVFALDFSTGRITEELGSDANKINEIIANAQNSEDFSDYTYPEQESASIGSDVRSIISNEINGKEIINNIETIIYGDLLFFNYYQKRDNNLLDNVFVIYNIDKRKKVNSEVINKNVSAFTPDSFFCYKNYLIVLKNKNEVVSYRIK